MKKGYKACLLVLLLVAILFVSTGCRAVVSESPTVSNNNK